MLERSHPVRSWAGGPAATGRETSPVEEAVSTAYQVFDRYLDEGRKYAAGRSAWYADSPSDGSGLPAPHRVSSTLMHGDLANALSRVIQDVAHLARDLTDAIALRPALGSRPSSPPARPFHPQQSPDYATTTPHGTPVWRESPARQPEIEPVRTQTESAQTQTALADRLAARSKLRWSDAADPKKQG